MSKPDPEDINMISPDPEDIKLTEDLYFEPYAEYDDPFYHVRKDGYFCGYVYKNKKGMYCDWCEKEFSKKEMFIINLMNFNE
jgi:hypothetical protein